MFTEAITAIRADRVSDLKKNPTAILADGNGIPIAVLNHNRVISYIRSAQRYEQLLDYVAELEDELIALKRLNGD